MSTPVGIIKKFVKALTETKKTGTAAADEAFKAVGAGSYSAFKSEFSYAQEGYSLQDFLEQKCDIRINNKDTGAITGSDAGSKTTKTDESIIPENTDAKVLTDDEYYSFTKNGLKVNIVYDTSQTGPYLNYNLNTYLAKQKIVVRALYNWWIPESLALINESLGVNFTDGRANTNEITVKFSSTTYSEAIKVDVDYDLGRASNITLTIEYSLLGSLTLSDKNGTTNGEGRIYSTTYSSSTSDYAASSPTATYLDQLVLQALTEVALKANVGYVDKLPKEVVLGAIEMVGGYDNGFVYSGYPQQYYGYALLRYLAKNYSDGMPDGTSYNKAKTLLTVTSDYTDKKLDLADFASTVKNVNASALKSGVIIVGNTLDNSIRGGSGNDSLVGGKGADTLWGGAGNDTLRGGNGNDLFIYSAGNDVIADYAVGDKISVGAAVSKTTLSGSDVVFTIGGKNLTVKNGKDKTLTLINSKGKEYTTVVSSAKTLNITNTTKSPVTLASDVGTADASKRTTAVKIFGNKSANVILGGAKADTIYGEGGNDSILGNAGADKLYGGFGNDTLRGGAGKDTLIGGAGNDSLWGDAGADTFIYSSGSGNDVIFGFDNKDTLTLDSLDFTASYKNKAVTLTFEEGSVTFKNFTASTFHINDDTYKISNNKFVKQ